jgi:hypothetical protein
MFLITKFTNNNKPKPHHLLTLKLAIVKINLKLLSYLALVVVTTFLSCLKTDLYVVPEVKHSSEEFFKLPINVDPEVARVAQNLKKQDAVLNFLPSFIKKNGISKMGRHFISSRR